MRLTMVTKLVLTSSALLVLTAVVGLIGARSLGDVESSGKSMQSSVVQPLDNVEQINAQLLERARLAFMGDLNVASSTVQATVDAGITKVDKTIDADISAFLASNPDAGNVEIMTQFQAALATYRQTMATARANTKAGTPSSSDFITTAGKQRAAAMTLIGQLISAQMARSLALNDGISATANAALLEIVAVLVLALLLGLGLAVFVARRLARDARRVQAQLVLMTESAIVFSDCLAALSRNDLTQTFHTKMEPIGRHGSDEIGQTAGAADALLASLKAMVGSYEMARVSLTETIGDVREAAESVARTSGEVNAAATQSGTATTQIAQTINEVASGATDQAQASSDTSNAVRNLSAIIDQVGAGAAETTRKVELASAALNATARAVSRAQDDAEKNAPIAQRIAASLGLGAQAAEKTSTGMSRIKAAVEEVSERITELGAKSGQIGAIVETIDDIAEQTNLLALNAAIEAARAGEQGKGFAVVADEVRKLAERSSRATKEIADLIGEVQTGTEQAVKAMEIGAAEVETGAGLADESTAALQEMKAAAEARAVVLADILDAVAEVERSSSEAIVASDAIATIAKQTDEAAAEMTSAARIVSGSVESIAAISEENSAAAEQVSAATQEMSAQAEQVMASAGSLAEMARELDSIVARFVLEDRSFQTPTDIATRLPKAA